MPRPNGDAAEDRIAELSARFRTHAVGRRPTNVRTRERQSLYLDTEVVTRANQAYRDLSHEVYPLTISKSAFWEAALAYALDHLPELRQVLLATGESTPQGSSEPPPTP